METLNFTLVEFNMTSIISMPDGTKVPGLASKGIARLHEQSEVNNPQGAAKRAFARAWKGAAVGAMLGKLLAPFGSPKHFSVTYHVHAALMPDLNALESNIMRVCFDLTEER